MAARGHDCPVCAHERVPLWWALCHSCYRILPPMLARELMHAYRHRMEHAARWDEALIACLQWRREWTQDREEAPKKRRSNTAAKGA